MFHMTDPIADNDLLPTVITNPGMPPYLSLCKDIEEYVRLHYSLPRRDVTDFFFKATIKEMKRQMMGPWKIRFLAEKQFEGHFDYFGKMQLAALHYFFHGTINFNQFDLPRQIVIRDFIKSLFPVVMERVHHVCEDMRELADVFRSQDEMGKEEKKYNQKQRKCMKKIMFGARFKFGDLIWSRIFYQSHRVIEKGYTRYSPDSLNPPEKWDQFKASEYTGFTLARSFVSTAEDQEEDKLDEFLHQEKLAPVLDRAVDRDGGQEVEILVTPDLRDLHRSGIDITKPIVCNDPKALTSALEAIWDKFH
jgi:hypothetical protein